MKINTEKLKEDLINTIWGAVHNGYPQAIIDITNVEKCDDIYVLRLIAREYGINPDEYLIDQ
jgi:hypothetical protein